MTLAVKPTLFEHDASDNMVAALSAEIEARLRAAIDRSGAASFAVSGGSTPKPLYEALSKIDLDWSRVTVVMVDERWVDPGEAGSNESFLRETLLQNAAADARFIGLKTPHDTPADALTMLEERLLDVPHPLDVVVLGMGGDGHTASWFPHADGLSEAMAHCGGRVAAIHARKSEVTGDWLDRITLTYTALDDAGAIYLMLSGADKRETLETALQSGSVEDMPVRALLRDPRAKLAIHWAP